MHNQYTHPRAAHNLLGYTTTIRSFTKRRQKENEDAEVRYVNGWLGHEVSFEEKTRLFDRYRIVNGAHEHFKSLRAQGRGAASASEQRQRDSSKYDIREDVDDIPWNQLTVGEKQFVTQHERLEITFAQQLHKPVPTFIGRRGKGRFLSWNEYKNIRKDDSSSSKSKRGTKRKNISEEPDPEKPSKKKEKVIPDWFKLVDETTDSEEEQASTTRQISSDR